MTIVVYSLSDSFKQHIDLIIKPAVSHRSNLNLSKTGNVDLHLIHASSFIEKNVTACLARHPQYLVNTAIAEDIPNVVNMLRYAHIGTHGYCNAYMALAHYEQLFAMLKSGQSWFPPALLTQALSIAHSGINTTAKDERLQALTPREKEVALCVAQGKSNKQVARELAITERTVKAHLSHVFEKLPVTDRVGLVLYLQI